MTDATQPQKITPEALARARCSIDALTKAVRLFGCTAEQAALDFRNFSAAYHRHKAKTEDTPKGAMMRAFDYSEEQAARVLRGLT